MAPMQKRAWWGLAAGLVFAAAFTLVFVLGGIATFDEDRTFRIVIDVLWIAGLVANLVIVNMALRRPGMADERDRRIFEKAPRIQWWAVIFTLVAWTVSLAEIYRGSGGIPTIFLYVMFMSVLTVSTLAQCLGIIIGYGRSDRNG